MIKIVICCSQGMTSSILVRKMREYIEQNHLDMSVRTGNVDRVINHELNFDILLLGPQIRTEKQRLKKLFPEKSIEVIEMKAYGRLDGESIIKYVLTLIQ